MYIQTHQKLNPFSHLPGTYCLLPGSSFKLQVFPTCLRVYDASVATSPLLSEFHLKLQGPIDEFTVQLDLEKGEVRVWGKTSLGFFRYRLKADRLGLRVWLILEKSPHSPLQISAEKKITEIEIKERAVVFSHSPVSFEVDDFFTVDTHLEKLDLGSFKLLESEKIYRRLDFSEIFPIWHKLGQLFPVGHGIDETAGEVGVLLKSCQAAAALNRPENLLLFWKKAFLVGFKSLFCPKLKDEDYLGIFVNPSLINLDNSPLWTLKKGFELIRQLFVKESSNTLKILPSLPPELHAGRLKNYRFFGGNLALEWTKKKIRRLEIATGNQSVELMLAMRDVKKYRLRKWVDKRWTIIPSNELLFLEKKSQYFFDNFQ